MKYHSAFFVIPLFLFSVSAMSAVVPKIPNFVAGKISIEWLAL